MGATPAAPQWAVSYLEPTQISLQWWSVPNATTYYVDELINSNWQPIATLGSSATSYTVTGLQPNTSYMLNVAAGNSTGVTWGTAQSVTTAVIPAPAFPQWTISDVETTQVTLQWPSVSNATTYFVYEWTGTSWQTLTTLGSSATSYTITGLSPNTSYLFNMAAGNSTGTTWGSAAPVTTLSPLAAPQWTFSDVETTQLTLQWPSVSHASNYYVDELIGTSWQTIATLGSSATSYTITGLSTNTSYSFNMAAGNSTGTALGTAATVTTPITNHPTINNPATDCPYFAAPNPTLLWGSNGPQYTDVQQGGAGDCWMLSAYAAIAARRPDLIESMFHYDGTWILNGGPVAFYDIRFYDSSGTAHTVTVDTELARGPYPGGYEYDQPVNGMLWVALLEKGYAEANGYGWVSSGDPGVDSYDAINVGSYPAYVLNAVTDIPAANYPIDSSQIATDWTQNAIICIWTVISPTNSNLVGDHAYAVVAYDSTSATPFDVFNQ